MRRYDHTLKYRIHRLIKWRFHRDCEEHLRMIMSTDPYILSHQNLDQILSFVSYNNRYYAKYFSDSRNLCNLPVLTKDVIRREFDNLNSTKQSASIYENTSGGSTGRPVLLIQDNEYESWSEATQKYYFREFLGTERNEVNSVWLWGSERDLLKLDSWIRRTRRSVSYSFRISYFSIRSTLVRRGGWNTSRGSDAIDHITLRDTQVHCIRWHVLRGNTTSDFTNHISYILRLKCFEIS